MYYIPKVQIFQLIFFDLIIQTRIYLYSDSVVYDYTNTIITREDHCVSELCIIFLELSE